MGRVPPGSGSWGEFVSHSPHPLFHSRVPGGRGRVSRLPPASSAPGCGSKDCLLPFTPPHSSQREKLLSVDRFPKIPLFWVWAALEKPAPPRGSESGSRGGPPERQVISDLLSGGPFPLDLPVFGTLTAFHSLLGGRRQVNSRGGSRGRQWPWWLQEGVGFTLA